MNFPEKLKYTEDHEWIILSDGNTAIIGITDFAQSELGDLVYLEVETVGETLEAGDVFGVVEAVKTTSELFMPISGKVLEVNSKLTSDGEDNPGLINEDPYGDGWIVKVEVTNPADLDALLSAEAYQEKIS